MCRVLLESGIEADEMQHLMRNINSPDESRLFPDVLDFCQLVRFQSHQDPWECSPGPRVARLIPIWNLVMWYMIGWAWRPVLVLDPEALANIGYRAEPIANVGY